MAICTFTIKAPGNASKPGDVTRPSTGESSYNGKGTLVYGTNVSNAVSYGVSTGTIQISFATWDNFRTKIAAERTRRGRAAVTITLENPISYSHFNALRTAIQVSSATSDTAYNDPANDGIDDSNGGAVALITTNYSTVAAQSNATEATQFGKIYAVDVNKLVQDINSAGAACTCNCNYCTCNCNYCTCNCNYSCTCNCNYSDERVKDQIVYM